MDKIKFKLLVEQLNRDDVYAEFKSFGDDYIRTKYNLSYGNLREFKNIFDLHLTKDEINDKRKSCWEGKGTSLKNKHTNLLESISKDKLVDIYLTNNNSFEDTCKILGICKNDLLFLLKEYDCKKPKNISSEISKNTKLEKYGDSNYNNRDKAKQTCLEKYGVDNPYKYESFIKKSSATKLNIYGEDNVNNWKKGFDTRIKNYGSIENSYKMQTVTYKQTCLEKYGVENSSYLDNVKQKIKESCENTFRELYGSSCYWTSNLAIISTSNDSSQNRLMEKLLINNGVFINKREFPINNRRYDFKIDNTLIEVNPSATHNSTWGIFNTPPKDKNYHYEKSKLARDNNYKCICVWDWDDKDKIIQLLKDRETIYARKCLIKEVSYFDAVEFINKYHFQGYAKDSIRIGLFYDEELVSIMTFGKPRYNKKYEYELIRYCASKNIIGGAEKLFKYFIENYKPESVISYCDLSKFDGKTYLKLNFKLDSISIGKHWYNPKTEQHITDNLLRQRGFDQLFKTDYGKGTSNETLMIEHGFVEIYDAGQATFIWKNKDID